MISNIKYKVVEQFESIDGEGKRAGELASFIRLAGCNLRCSYCDTIYALFGEEECKYEEIDAKTIIENLRTEIKNVTITGGEPLIQHGIISLVSELINIGLEVNIETNGAVDISPVLMGLEDNKKMFLTIDYKLPSSLMENKMIWRNFELLRPFDVLKLVIGSDEDASRCVEVVNNLRDYFCIKNKQMPLIYLGAVHGKYPESKIVKIMQKYPSLYDARLQLQMHKIVWSAKQRGV